VLGTAGLVADVIESRKPPQPYDGPVKAALAQAAAGRKDPIRLRHDRAGGGLVGCDGDPSVCEDTPLAHMYACARTVRFADGPDEVHRNQIGKLELEQYLAESRR
jgi:alkylation response protein AidB-like acyl-CoA dehydrogenase